MDRTRMTGTPPRRAARPIRVRARFTPTRSTVFRAAPGFDAVVDPTDPQELLPGTDPSVDGPATAPTAGADAGPTAATVDPVDAPVVEDRVVEEPADTEVVEEPVDTEDVEAPVDVDVREEPVEASVEAPVEVVEAPVEAPVEVVDAPAEPAEVPADGHEPVAAAAVVTAPVVHEPVAHDPVAHDPVAHAPVEPAAVPHPVAPAVLPPAPPAPPARSPAAVPPPVPTPPDPATDPYRDSESLAQALGLKPPPPGAPEVAVARKGPRARRDAAGPRRRWLPVALVAAAVAVLVVVMSVRAAVTGDAEPRAATSGSPGASATPTSAAAAAAVAAWLQANPVGARTVAADPEATALRSAGVEVTSGPLASAGTGDTVVLSRPAAAVTDPVPVTDASSWVPLAVFGDGDRRAVVGVVLGRAATDVAADRDSAAATAAAACTALGKNVAVDIGADARPVFDAGLVDLRATAFLAALSQETPVEVAAVRVDDAERAAGTAARVVEVAGAAGDAVRSMAEQAHGSFAPTVTDGDGGRLVLTWSVEADPASLTAR